MADSSLASLLSALTGSTKTQTSSGGTTTSTQTQTTDLSESDVAKLLQSALESNSGLASVASGQAGSGLYNSTVNTQLINDLLSRLSTQIASQAAPKTTTTSTVTPSQTVTSSTPGILGTTSTGSGLAALLGLSLAKNTIDPYLSGKKKLTDLAKDASSLFTSDSELSSVVPASFDAALASSTDSLGASIDSVTDFSTPYSALADINLGGLLEGLDLSSAASDIDWTNSLGNLDFSGVNLDGTGGASFDFSDFSLDDIW